jgi:hypothetical protein
MYRRKLFMPGDLPALSANEERRSSVRHRVSFELVCRQSNGGGDIKARVRDVSNLGVGMVLPVRVEAGTLLEIELQGPTGRLIRRTLGRVAHVDQEQRGMWLVGCAFVDELTRDELLLFQADAIRAKASDNRRWVRFPCNVETVCYTCDAVPGESRPARVVNISAGGVGLLLPCQFSQGTLLHFEIPNSSQPLRHGIIRVVRVIEHPPGMWYLGCEFAQQLDDDELRSLLR